MDFSSRIGNDQPNKNSTCSRVILLILILFCSAPYSEASDVLISLEGVHKFSPGDDRRRASSQYNDAGWRRVQIPGSWQSQGLYPKEGMGWYRIRLKRSEQFKGKSLGVALGFIGNADETSLNGVKIGGEGVVGHRFVEATRVERLYKIPAGLLKDEGVNLLTVRVMNTFLHGGIFAGTIGIGDYKTLQISKLQRDFTQKAEEIGIFSITFIFLLSCLLLYFAGIRESEYIYFSGFVFICLLCFILDSLIFYESGLKNAAVQQILAFLYGLFPVSMFCFLIQFVGHRFNHMIRGLIGYSILVSFLLLFLGNLNYHVYVLLVYLWAIEVFLIGVAGVYLAVGAYTAKRPESGPVLLGVIVLAFSGFIALLNAIGITKFDTLYIDFYIYLFFMMCVVYALVIRFLRFRASAKKLSGRILNAHEEERKRLARELHDGLGQNLLAVKFNLQMVNQPMKNQRIGEIIDEITGNIDELRRISMGLSSPFLEVMGIGAAINTFGKQFFEKTGIKITVASDKDQ